MKHKTQIDPLWVIGCSALAETLNPYLAHSIVAYIQDTMEWSLSNPTNDILWGALEDEHSH